MPEVGGTATQAGIYYQNSVAALALADLLDLDRRVARERATDVRLEAPESVDDIVIRYADGHREFQSVKLSVQIGGSAWPGIWRSFAKQCALPDASSDDQVMLVVGERTPDSAAVAALCERASGSVDVAEMRDRLSQPQVNAFNSIAGLVAGDAAAFEVVRRVQVKHLPAAEIERELGRRRLAGAVTAPPALLPILRDMAGGEARRRGLFQPAPLRRRLQREHRIILGEPPEWGLAAYRAAVKQLSRIEVPGLRVSGPAEQLFVWPRARSYDRNRPADFEDETPAFANRRSEDVIDLKAFPGEQLERVIVVAGPGYGKSALLTAIAGTLADGPLVPVHVPLASLAAADSSVIAFLGATLSQELDLSADWQRLAEQGLLVLLFDGLDEVPASERPALMRRIATFSARYPRAPWMLTVRDAAVVTGLPTAQMVELLPLDDADVERFAVTMHDYLGEIKSWQVAHRIKLCPDLDRLARIPLFLIMLIASGDLGTATTLSRADLIEAYLGTLFAPGRHKTVRDPTDRSVALRKVAERLAFERLERQEIGATECEVRTVVDAIAASPEEAAALFEQLLANGVLKPQSAIRLQFPYPIVQEYLAARHLVDHYPGTLGQRIDDAVQRPWAQVIQFALELHPAPEPVIRAMLERPDDAFATGLRLVGRCIANGANVSGDLRSDVGDRLIEYWVQAPSRSRERVGRLLADGFSEPISAALEAVLHHRWLLEHGAGDIVSKRGDNELTTRVLAKLVDNDDGSIRIYHNLKPALRLAGDAALQTVIDALDPRVRKPKEIEEISSLFNNFNSACVSRYLALSPARDERLPDQTRLRAYKLAGHPLEQSGIDLALAGLRHPDWDAHYTAGDLFDTHDDPAAFLSAVLRDETILLKRRQDLAGRVALVFPDPAGDCRKIGGRNVSRRRK